MFNICLELIKEEQIMIVSGNIKKCYSFWENDLKASPYVLNIVKNGYSIPFVKTPTPFFAKNNLSSLKNKDFIEATIKELIQNKCIEE